jgi:hypothetical protein
MALILAIEPDRRQASKLAAIVKNRLHEEILQADTTEHAIAALGARVPDLILTSLLLSRKDDAALTDWLRASDEAGAHVQTLVIPVLGGSSRDGEDGGGGLLSRLTRNRSRDDVTTDGCEPEVFAAQIREYLERAAEERRHLLEDAEAAQAAAKTGATGSAERIPLSASIPSIPTTDHVPSMQSRSWDQPYADGSASPQPQHFEVEAVTPEPMEAAPAAAGAESAQDEDAWSEISLSENPAQVDASAIGGNYLLDEDDGAALELNSEPIDLQRFVEELANDPVVDRTPAPRSGDNVLAEFEEALEVIEEPNRPDGHSEADSEVLTPLVASTAWPHLDSTVAKPEAAAEEPAAAPSAARPRSRKKSRAAAPQAEWKLFDPEQCGFSALLAKLDQMAD